MTPEQVLLLTMADVGMRTPPGTLESLIEALKENNIYFFDKDGEPSGFVTWFMDGDTLEVNNLCLFESGIHKLYELRDFFHSKYPDLKKVRWWDDKHEKPFEVRLKGNNDGRIKDEYNQRPVTAAKDTSC